MTSNFSFLAARWPGLAQTGTAAEQYLHSDPNACIFKLGLFAEGIVGEIFEYEKLTPPEDDTQAERLKLLQRGGFLPRRVDDILYALRKARNEAVHNGLNCAETAESLLRMAFNLAVWFMQTYGDPAFSAEDVPSLTLSRQDEQYLESAAIRLDVTATQVLNFALQQGGFPILRSVSVINGTDAPLEDLDIRVNASPAICLPLTKHISFVGAGAILELKDLRPVMNIEFLAGLTEQTGALLEFTLTQGDRILCTEHVEVTALAFDQWHGSGFYPELLCAFVTPNHPAIAGINARAARILENWTGNPSLNAYQTQDPNRVLSQAAAIFQALKEQDIIYVVAPASFTQVGQRVRMCDTVLTQKMGNCLDLTLLYAACLESAGLRPILLLTSGHIFSGVWLEPLAFPEAVQDDASLVTKRLAGGINEIAVVECTAFTAGKDAHFDQARDAAEQQLVGQAPVEYIIDVNRARLSGIRPLPQRLRTDSGWQVTTEPAPQSPSAAPKQISAPITLDESADPTTFPKQTQWERKLLDLGLRNQLINLRLTKNTLPILTTSLDDLENALAAGSDFSIWPRPSDFPVPPEEVNFENIHDLGNCAGVITSEFQNKRLRSTCLDTELNRILKGLYRASRLAMEENGANTLYLALGLLRWYEADRSTKARYAPIVLLPVEIIRRSAARGYTIRLRDEDAQMNITMLEKMKQDFQITVTGLDPLPVDEKGIDIRKVFTILRKAIMEKNRWDILESAYLGIFSFSQFVMWNDIRNRSEDLERSKIVRSLIDGRLAWDAEAMEIGDRVPEDRVLLPLPADASQLFAIKEACEGKSFVLHGPPGTGKSQTITTLIANALAQDKTVLFVAEKMAALEVVQRRLENIGVGPFCLELHSNKSKKKDVLEQLRQASEAAKHASSEEYLQKADRLAALRHELDAYATALHAPQPCGRSLYQLIDGYEASKDALDLTTFGDDFVEHLSAADLERHETTLDRLASAANAVGHPHGHPLAPVGCKQYSQKLRMELEPALAHYHDILTRLESASTTMSAALEEDGHTTFAELEKLAAVAEELGFWLEVPRAWAQAENPAEYLSGIQTLATGCATCAKLDSELTQIRKYTEILRSALLDAANHCRATLDSACGAARELAQVLEEPTPVTLDDYNRMAGIARELEHWLTLPPAWAKVENISQELLELGELAQHYLTAASIRSRYSVVWNDSFWTLDAKALLAEYQEISGKWFLPKRQGMKKLVALLTPHARVAFARESLGDYLAGLNRYQNEMALVRSLMVRHSHTLDAYAAKGPLDWKKIAADADRARTSAYRCCSELDAAALLKKDAGVQAHANEIRQLLADWPAHTAARDQLLNLVRVREAELGEDWQQGLKDLCDEIEAHSGEIAAWITWHTLATAALREREIPGMAQLATQTRETVDAILPDTAAKWLCRKAIVPYPFLKGVFAKNPQGQRLCEVFRQLSQYYQLQDQAATLLPRHRETLGSLYQEDATDWQRIADDADTALDSAQRLRILWGSDEIRLRCGGDPDLAPAIHDLGDTWPQLRQAKAALDTILSLDNSREDDNWIAGQLALCAALMDNGSSLKEWITWNAIAAEAEEMGLSDLVSACRSGTPVDQLGSAYRKAMYKALAVRAIDSEPALGMFSGAVFNEKISQFKRIDAEITRLAREEIYCRMAARIPNFAKEAARSSEVGILQRAIRSGGRGISIRKLFEQIPNLLPKLCPCMLMSPISAAQYLDPKREPFDIVVFDEASQLPTCKAVGVLARGRNAVIVGDPKQMPPTSFFSNTAVDEENLDIEDLESILDDCLAMNMPQTHLLWHYRSRHESLIAFSNAQFYENKLYTFPSVNDRESKVTLRHIDGVFERGKNRQNRAEAQAIVEELKRRCYDSDLRRRSVGVVTFNISQQHLIDDLLMEACAQDPKLESWAFESKEPLFIKNLENVQGDERDVILFSIGYGPDEKGKVYMNFGPLNRDGGWRRLNVAVSRARHEMVVFSTLTPDQINLSRTSAQGVAALKAFLEYAAGQPLSQDENAACQLRPDREGIAHRICQMLAQHGYQTDRAVGHSAYRIDVGVIDPENPDRYLLGILLDGPCYGEAKTTRDRELSQISILEGLGWKLLRVWSMDWWDNTAKELQRILTALEQAKTVLEIEPEPEPPVVETPTVETEIIPTQEETPVSHIYHATELPQTTADQELFLSSQLTGDIRQRVIAILAHEAPISEGLLTRRLLQSFSIPRSGAKIQARLEKVFESLNIQTTLQNGQKIYWNTDQDPAAYTGLRASGDGIHKREAKDVPVQEAVNAVLQVLDEQISLVEDDLIREAARLLGYTRLGNTTILLLSTAIRQAERQGAIVIGANGNWILAEEETPQLN
ncbi:MAG: DUF3320 domain-containing protein [Oscillospiraceae bacterium]|nr:DUF3320 domain-containing protein [Oscillospiraceae bacterium]